MTMWIIASRYIFIILFSIFHGSIEDASIASTSASVTAVITTITNTNKSSSLLCPGGHINPPNCTQCASQYENNDTQCNEIKNLIKTSRDTGHRTTLIIFVCLLSTLAILAILIVYVRLNQQRGVHSTLSPGHNMSPSTHHTNATSRFRNILRTIGFNNPNKRGLLSYFSRSNNNNNNNINTLSGQRGPSDTSRVDSNENLDEALLFDDPYADGTLNSGSTNPYKSLTLSIT